MLGMIFGGLCLVALIATVRRRRYWGHHAYGALYDRDDSRWEGGFGGPAMRFRRGAWGGGGRRVLRELFIRLDTSPGQEKAIASSLHEARSRLSELRGELRSVKQEVAALIGSDVLDVVALEAVLGQQQVGFDRVRNELVRTLSTIHEALDTRQRRELGELLADGSLGLLARGARRGC